MTDPARADLEQWWRELAAALGVEPDLDTDSVLDLAALAAHTVVRPAAPLSTFLVGYAAGLAGGGPEAEARAVAVAEQLARQRAGDEA